MAKKTTNTRFQILCKLVECGASGGNRTIRAYLFYVTYCKHTNARTAQPAVWPPPLYKIMYNEIGRCGVAHRARCLRRLLYLHACFFGASIRCVPGPCSIQWKARATTFCRQMATHSVLSFEALASAAVSLTLMAAGHASGWPILRGGAFLQEIQYLTSQSEHQGTRLPRASPFPAPTLEI